MNIYRLDQFVLAAQGNAASFLNGLTSNDLSAPQSAFLNVHGRIIATFWQQKVSDDGFLLTVPSSARVALEGHLARYAALNRTQLTWTDKKAYMDLSQPPAVMIRDEEEHPQADEEAFTLYRLKYALPLMGIDYQADEFILNVHETNHVSYTKGCFLGQEPVAKVHNRSKPSRKLLVKYADECGEEDRSKMSSACKDPVTGRVMGFVFVKNI